MKTAILAIVTIFCSIVNAQTSTTYSDASGRVIGYGSTVGNQTTYSDAAGRVIGYESQIGISSTYSNSLGQVTGYGSTLGQQQQPGNQPQPLPPFFNQSTIGRWQKIKATEETTKLNHKDKLLMRKSNETNVALKHTVLEKNSKNQIHKPYKDK